MAMMDSLRPLLPKTRSQKCMFYKVSSTMSSSSLSMQSSSRSLMSSSRSLMSGMGWDEDDCLSKLDSFCTEDKLQVTSQLILRYAIFHNFDYDDAKAAVEKCAFNKYLNLRMHGDLAEQFASNLLFPLSNLTLKLNKSQVIYVRPSQYQPSPENEDLMIKSLCYVLNDCTRSEAECHNGVAMVINMNEWSTENFSSDVWKRFMSVLQGELVPTKVKMVVIVDAPKEFVAIWNVLKKSLQTKFSKKVRLIKEAKLGTYLMDGYQKYLPSDFCGTWRDANELCEDYVDQKAYNDQ
ncbi:MAG: hypothetical protein SGBAC_008000 [Bacillariaceae sp.]